jgi:hypothetical protein
VLGCLPPIAVKKVSKSQINRGIVLLNNNATQKLLFACGGWFQGYEQKTFQTYLSEMWCQMTQHHQNKHL